MKFIIYFVNNKVKVYDDDREVYIKFEGEEEFPFFPEFWEWFKRKIEYDNEEISFVIISDKDIKLPKEFNIAQKSRFEKLPVLLTTKKTKIFTYPKIEEENIKKKKVKENSIFEHFIKKATLKKKEQHGNNNIKNVKRRDKNGNKGRNYDRVNKKTFIWRKQGR